MPILAATAFATKQSRQPSLLPRRSAGSRSRESSSDGRYGPPRSKAQRQGSARNQGAKPRAEIEGGSVKAGGGSAPGAGGGSALEGGSGRGLNRPKAGGGSAPTFYISPPTSGVMDQMTDDRPKVSGGGVVRVRVCRLGHRRQELLRHADVVRHRAARCI